MTKPETDPRQFEWTIDANDRIVSVDPNWLAYAEENDPYYADPFVVQGRPLSDFIVGSETRYLYSELLARVRSRQAITVPFRCDSPGCRRFMEATLSPLTDGGVRFVSRTLRLEYRPEVELMADRAERSSDMLVMCSWCKKIKLPAGEFVEIEQAIDALDLFAEPVLPHLTHACCTSCLDELTSAMA